MRTLTGRGRQARSLPIKNIGDAGLADALVQRGCPLCRVRQDAARQYLESVLWESVNDRGFRARFAASRGFCRAHVHELLKAERSQSGGSLGTAILLGASARVRLAELERLSTADGRRSRAGIEQAKRPPECPACESVASSNVIAIGTLLDRIDDDAWRAALAHAELCLDDLLLLWTAAAERGDAAWPEIASAQRTRIRELADRLESFVYHSSYDRRHLLTDDKLRASDEAAALLGGSRQAR